MHVCIVPRGGEEAVTYAPKTTTVEADKPIWAEHFYGGGVRRRVNMPLRPVYSNFLTRVTLGRIIFIVQNSSRGSQPSSSAPLPDQHTKPPAATPWAPDLAEATDGQGWGGRLDSPGGRGCCAGSSSSSGGGGDTGLRRRSNQTLAGARDGAGILSPFCDLSVPCFLSVPKKSYTIFSKLKCRHLFGKNLNNAQTYRGYPGCTFQPSK
jgi:hypothetical protein